MSTKIYNAYIVKLRDYKEYYQFVKGLQQLAVEDAKRQIYKRIADKIVQIHDEAVLYRTEHSEYFSSSPIAVLYDDFPKSLVEMYINIVNPPKRMLANPQNFYKIEKDNRFFLATILEHLCVEDVLSKSEYSMLSERNDSRDYRNEIVFFQTVEKKIVFQVFGSQIEDLFYHACWNPEKLSKEALVFFAKYDVRDFHYQNQTDRPESVTEEEWKFREATWERIMPSGIPARDGICTVLLDGNSIRNHFYDTEDTTEKLMQYVKQYTKERRCESLVSRMIESLALLEGPGNFESATEVAQYLRKVKSEIQKESGTWFQLYWKIKTEIEKLLPEDILETSIKMRVKDLLARKE